MPSMVVQMKRGCCSLIVGLDVSVRNKRLRPLVDHMRLVLCRVCPHWLATWTNRSQKQTMWYFACALGLRRFVTLSIFGPTYVHTFHQRLKQLKEFYLLIRQNQSFAHVFGNEFPLALQNRIAMTSHVIERERERKRRFGDVSKPSKNADTIQYIYIYLYIWHHWPNCWQRRL